MMMMELTRIIIMRMPHATGGRRERDQAVGGQSS